MEKRIAKLLDELRREVDRSEEIDADTLEMVRELERQVLARANPALPDDEESITELTATLEARFAVDHPIAARFLRDIIEALEKMGI